MYEGAETPASRVNRVLAELQASGGPTPSPKFSTAMGTMVNPILLSRLNLVPGE